MDMTLLLIHPHIFQDCLVSVVMWTPVCVHFVFQLTVVIKRIMAFSMACPLAKFLNGLEILLSKAQVKSLDISKSY